MLRVDVKAKPRRAIEELSSTFNQFNQHWETLQEHLQQIEKVSRAGVWASYNLSGENKLIDPPHFFIG